MANGYTAPIEDREDFTFEEFVWRCAGAPMPRERVLDQWHERGLAKARVELVAAEAMSDEEAERFAHEAYARYSAEHAASVARERVIHKRYMAMLRRVEEWTPPPEHTQLREFMLTQINEATAFMDPNGTRCAPALPDGPAWRAERIRSAKWLVAFHEEGWAREQERVRKANAMVAALAASVPPPKGALRWT